MSTALAGVLGGIFGLIVTILAFIFFLPEEKKEKFKDNKFLLWLHDVLHFKTLLIEKILRFLYILCTAAVIFAGFFMIFTKGNFGAHLLGGLLTMIIGPIVVRIAYELMMLAIIAVNNIIQINKKMPGAVSKEDESITD